MAKEEKEGGGRGVDLAGEQEFKHLNAYFKKPEIDLTETIFFLAKLDVDGIILHAPSSIKLNDFLRICFEVEEQENGELKLIKNKFNSFVWTLPKFNPNQGYNDSWIAECPRLSAFKYRVAEIIKILLTKMSMPWKKEPVKNFINDAIKISIFKVDNQTQDNHGYVWYVEILPDLALKHTTLLQEVGKDIIKENSIPLFSIIKTCYLSTFVNSLMIKKLHNDVMKKFTSEMANIEHLWDSNRLFNCTCDEPHWYKKDKKHFEDLISKTATL